MSPQIHVINLPSASKRREQCSEQLDATQLPYYFFNAVDNKDPLKHFDDIDFAMFRLMTRRSKINLNEVACYASHKALWRKCVKLNQPITILEDDFLLGPEFLTTHAAALDYIDRYNFIRLESLDKKRSLMPFIKSKRLINKNNEGISLYHLRYVPLCMLAYVISPKGAKKLLSSSKIYKMPVDKFLQQYQLHKQPIFGITPTTVSTSDQADLSTIGNRKKKSFNLLLLLHRMVTKASMDVSKMLFNWSLKL
jgi:glycosyl transferase, family 25